MDKKEPALDIRIMDHTLDRVHSAVTEYEYDFGIRMEHEYKVVEEWAEESIVLNRLKESLNKDAQRGGQMAQILYMMIDKMEREVKEEI